MEKGQELCFFLQALSNLHLKNPDYEQEPTDLEVGVSVCDLKKVFRVCELLVFYILKR